MTGSEGISLSGFLTVAGFVTGHMRKYTYLILTLTSAAIIRAIPIFLSWPYAVGWDTTALYIPAMLSAPPSPYTVLTYPGLHLLIFWGAYRILPNPFLILNASAVILQSGLACSFYLYMRRIASLDQKFAYISSLFFSTSPITLRLTWDQYRMSFALIAVMFVFIVLQSNSKSKGILASTLTLLVVLVNPLPAALLLLCLLADSIVGLAKGLANRAEFSSFLIGGTVFAIQQLLPGEKGYGQQSIPFAIISIPTGVSTGIFGLGYLLFTCWPLLLFLPLGWHIRERKFHNYWFYFVAFFGFPLFLVGIGTVPPEYTYLMISFPLAVILGYSLKNSQSRIVCRLLLGVTLTFLVVNSFSYIASSPLQPTPYSLIGQSYADYMPLGYLQSTVPISYETDLMQLLDWSLGSLPPGSSIYVPQQFYGLILMTPNRRNLAIVNIGEVNPSLPSPFKRISPAFGAYTVWFANPNGWYGVTSLPQNYIMVEGRGVFAVYRVGIQQGS